jgi:uncharacterized repeat protein (TIGR01451 family)
MRALISRSSLLGTILFITAALFTSAAHAQEADLAVARSGPATVVAGTEMTYTIDVSNAGPADAVDVIVIDIIPAGTTYVSDTDSCVEAPAGTLTCPLGGIVTGAVDSFDVTVSVPAGAIKGTILTNPA